MYRGACVSPVISRHCKWEIEVPPALTRHCENLSQRLDSQQDIKKETCVLPIINVLLRKSFAVTGISAKDQKGRLALSPCINPLLENPSEREASQREFKREVCVLPVIMCYWKIPVSNWLLSDSSKRSRIPANEPLFGNGSNRSKRDNTPSTEHNRLTGIQVINTFRMQSPSLEGL